MQDPGAGRSTVWWGQITVFSLYPCMVESTEERTNSFFVFSCEGTNPIMRTPPLGSNYLPKAQSLSTIPHPIGHKGFNIWLLGTHTHADAVHNKFQPKVSTNMPSFILKLLLCWAWSPYWRIILWLLWSSFKILHWTKFKMHLFPISPMTQSSAILM